MQSITQFYSMTLIDAFDKHLLSTTARSDHPGLVSTESTDQCRDVLDSDLSFVYWSLREGNKEDP